MEELPAGNLASKRWTFDTMTVRLCFATNAAKVPADDKKSADSPAVRLLFPMSSLSCSVSPLERVKIK